MKKLLALLIAMMMTFSICSFTAMAENVLFEDISNGQLANFIVADLAIPEGATVTSTNEDVIALDGTVTRPLFEDAAVTLTVNGTAFDLVVKSKKINVINAFDFSENCVLTRSTASPIPTGEWLNKQDSSNIGTVKFENGVMAIGMTNLNGGTTKAEYYPAQDTSTAVKYYAFDLDTSAITGTNSAAINVRVQGYSEEGAATQISYENIYTIRASEISVNNTAYSNSGTAITDGKIVFGINPETGEFYYRDGTGTMKKKALSGYSTYRIDRIRIANTSNCVLDLNVDNFIEYEEVDNFAVIGSLSDAEKVSYFKNIIESAPINNGKLVANADLDLDAAYADMNIADYGVSVEWASSNTDAITNDGVLVSDATSSYVTMTATIAAGEESETVEYTVKATQAGSVNMDTLPSTVVKAQAMSSEDFEDGAAWWTNANASVTIDADVTHNKVLAMTGVQGETKSATYNAADYGNISPRPTDAFDQRYFVNADVKATGESAFVLIGGSSETATEVWFDFAENKINLLTSRTMIDSISNGTLKNGNVTVSYDMPAGIENGDWVSLTLDYNVKSRTFIVYLDGQQINDIPLLKANNAAAYLTSGNRTPIRGIGLKTNGESSVSIDNLDIRRVTDADAVAVNASLNAALIAYASELTSSSLINVEFMEKTINDATNDTDTRNYNYDASDIVNNPAMYLYDAENGPSLTYKVNGVEATSYKEAKINEIELTITATYNGVTEAKTVRRKASPASVNYLYSSVNALNAIQVTGIADGDKILLGSYNQDGKMINVDTISYSDMTANGCFAVERINSPGVNGVAYYKIFVVSDKLSPIAHVTTVE